MNKYRIVTTEEGKYVVQKWIPLYDQWEKISIPSTLEFAQKVVKNNEEKDKFIPKVVYQTPETKLTPKPGVFKLVRDFIVSLYKLKDFKVWK